MVRIYTVLVTACLAALGTLAIAVGPAIAETDDQCMSTGATCVQNADGSWTPVGGSFDGTPDTSGIVTIMVILVVIGAAVSIAVFVWKVNTAQRLARESGLDPSTATAVSMFTENGLDATYLAASLRDRPGATDEHTAEPAERRSTEERLAELTRLRDSGAITPDEYEAQRKAIIGTV